MRAIVAETEALGATVSAVARRNGVVTNMLFRWPTGSKLRSRAFETHPQLTMTESIPQAPLL
ncbi:transposase [Caulobacter sp. BE254]|uniref:transposase n=1 Tax=Caulobacter sp. BE254 TaxID=2817720 RepID=UPI003857E9C4